MIVLHDEAATLALGRAIGTLLCVGDLIGLSGELGAGKTVLARGMVEGAGHGGEVPSPSFPIVITYDPPAVRLPVAHVDLYRLDPGATLDEFGLGQARGDGAVIVEWPDRLGVRDVADMLDLALAVLPDGARGLTVRVPTAWEARWPLR